ncbi:MAG TPA: hypothetical protein VGG44_00160 [Tepidisphaeraceae bacterium]|jgi:hypothetical protein
MTGFSKITGMVGIAAESLALEGGGKIDRVLIELRKDAEELKADQTSEKKEIIQEGMSDIAEVINRLEGLRQVLIRC